MGEIEHFVDPLDKSHPKLASVAHEVLTLFTAEGQVRATCACGVLLLRESVVVGAVVDAVVYAAVVIDAGVVVYAAVVVDAVAVVDAVGVAVVVAIVVAVVDAGADTAVAAAVTVVYCCCCCCCCRY